MERINERYHRCNHPCGTRFALRWFESHGSRRALALFCAFFLALQALIPCKAAFAYYPSEEVILGDQVTTDNFGIAGVGYMVIAYSNLRATLLALGVQPTDSRLTSEVRAKLSNASSGGSFYEYSTTFLTQFQLSGELPPWTFGVRDFIDTWETIAGSGDQYGPYMDVFYSSASRELYNNAKSDLEIVLAGGSLGGSSGDEGDPPSGYTDWTGGDRAGDVFTLVGVQYNEGEQTWDYSRVPSNVSAILGDRVFVYSRTYSGTSMMYGCFLVPDGVRVLENNNKSLYLYNQNDTSVTLTLYYASNYISPDITGVYYPMSFYDYTFTLNAKSFMQINSISNVSSMGRAYYKGGGNANPPSNWPTDPTPTPPTSPTVPDPPTTTPVDPPSDPVGGTPPTFPIQIITTDTTYPVADLQAVLDAMAEHCEHIRDEIYADTSGLYDNLTQYLSSEYQTMRNHIGLEVDWLMESLESEFQSLKDYLKDLAEWLADQMQFDISGGDYDDSTVVSWLKRIYLKLGNNPVNTKPVDPVADPSGAWEWLEQLINGILSALSQGAAALTGTLGQLFNGIKTKFPFSIPWDVAAIVTLFDAAPVTPAFTIQYSVFNTPVRYDIDLHFFDEQAAVIRAVENVLFCAYLLFKTNWLVGIFDGFGDFLGGKLRSAVKSP